MPRFRRKPVYIEARLWTGDNLAEMRAWCNAESTLEWPRLLLIPGRAATTSAWAPIWVARYEDAGDVWFGFLSERQLLAHYDSADEPIAMPIPGDGMPRGKAPR
jgi:hypothetical protein